MLIKIALIVLVLFIVYKIVTALKDAKKSRDVKKVNQEIQETKERVRAERDSMVQQKLTGAKEYRTGNVIDLTRQLDEFLEKKRALAEYTDFVHLALSDGNYFAKYWLMAQDNLRNAKDFMKAASETRKYQNLISGQDWADMMADILLLGADTQKASEQLDREEPQFLRDVRDAISGGNYSKICPFLFESSSADAQMLLHILLPRISLYDASAQAVWGLSKGEYIRATLSYWADRQLGEPQYLFTNDYQEPAANSWKGRNAPKYKDHISVRDLYRFRSNAVFRHYAVCSDPAGDGGFRLLKELIDNDAEAAVLFQHENAVTNTWFHVLLCDWLNCGDPLSPIVLQDQICRHNMIIDAYGKGPDGMLVLHALGTSDILPYLSKLPGSQIPDLFAFYLLAHPDEALVAKGGFFENDMDMICKTVSNAGWISQSDLDEYRNHAKVYALRLKDNYGIKIDDQHVLPRIIYSMDGKVWEYQTDYFFYEREGGKTSQYDIYRMEFPKETIKALYDGYIRVSGIQKHPLLTDTNLDASLRTYRNVEFRW